MDLNQLETFISVSNHLSFTKASEELFITQSSVSKIIKSLEEELGAQLFYRTPEIRLTDVGKELYKHSVDIISLIDNIPSELENLTNLKRGKIRIGIPPIIGSSFFPAIIGRFKEKYPGIEITLVEVGSKIIEEELNSGNLDVGIICSYPEQRQSFEISKLLQSELLVGIHKDNPLAAKDELSFGDLANENFVLFNKDFSLYDSIIDSCNRHGYMPKIICNSSQKDFIIEMIAARMGVTCLPQITCENVNNPEIRFIPMKDPKIYLNLMMVWKKDRYLPYACKEWIKFTANELLIDVEI